MIYFIQNMTSKAIKIGYSGNVKGRMRTLRTASADPLELLGAIEGNKAGEHRLHRRFAVDRLAGEWFRPSEELNAFILASLEKGKADDGRPTTKEACDLMTTCVAELDRLLSSSCDLKIHVFGCGGPCDPYPELGETEFDVRIFIRDPETGLCGAATVMLGDDQKTIQTRIAEVVAEIEERNGSRHYSSSRLALAKEACRLANVCNKEMNRVRMERPDVDIWGDVDIDFFGNNEDRADVVIHAGSMGDLSDAASGICRHGDTIEQVRAEIASIIERHDEYTADRQEVARPVLWQESLS